MSFLELILVTIVIALVVTVFALIISNKAVPDIRCDDDIVALVQKGERLQAIKAYRQLHGVGVKEAKKAITEFEFNLQNKEKSSD